jgi:hypothetical protein
MNYDFTRAVDYAGKYDREEMLEYLMEKMSGTGMIGAMKAKVFIEHMEKYSVEELEKRLKK